MYRILLTAVDIIPAAVVLIPVFCVLYRKIFECDLRKTVLYCLFCLYVSAVFALVGIPNVYYFRPEINLNLIPLRGMLEDLSNGLLNIVLFVPLGLFLPMLWQRFRRPMNCIVLGLCFSLIIELLQMLTFRATDVNDLITNTAGTMVGFLLAKPLTRNFPTVGEGAKDVYILMVLSFGVMFFLQPLLSPLIWDNLL